MNTRILLIHLYIYIFSNFFFSNKCHFSYGIDHILFVNYSKLQSVKDSLLIHILIIESSEEDKRK